MLSLFGNSCRGYLKHAITSTNLSLRKCTSQVAAAIDIPVPEKPAPKESHLIIKCKHNSQNFYDGQIYEKFQPIPLTSKGWRHRKSINDYFILYPDAKPEDAFGETGIISFEQSDLSKQLLDNLKENDLNTPSEIQCIAIPVLLSGKNSVIAAETGCGKTLAYLLPLLQQIMKWKSLAVRNFNEPLGLILCPSRDLTQQLGLVAKKMAKDTDINVQVVVGGRTKRQMLNPTYKEIDLLIGSLGAISKLTTTAIYSVSAVRHVVLEEADTLLDDSFNEKLRHMLKKIKFGFAGPESGNQLPNSSQLTLVSATMPTSITETLEIVNSESLVRLTTDKLHKLLPQVRQKFIRMKPSSKMSEILKIAKESVTKNHQTIIFCNTTKTCDWLYLFLREMGINCCHTHGRIQADLRSDKFAEFQRGNFNILVTTDACSRGLDTTQVKHVVNYDFPLYMADYIHRCGRTGRLGNTEKCYVTNFISGEREIELVQKIETAIRTSSPLPSVNGNITNIINKKIKKQIDETQSLMNASRVVR